MKKKKESRKKYELKTRASKYLIIDKMWTIDEVVPRESFVEPIISIAC